MLPTFKEFIKEEDNKKTLYIRRNLLNGQEFIQWAKEQGFGETVTIEELHVTMTYSKKKVNWNEIVNAPNEYTSPKNTYERKVIPLGDKGALVLVFEDDKLKERWKEIIEQCGAEWEYPSYHPHVTISYQKQTLDPNKIKPFGGDLYFGEEIFAELDEGWGDKVKHEKT